MAILCWKYPVFWKNLRKTWTTKGGLKGYDVTKYWDYTVARMFSWKYPNYLQNTFSIITSGSLKLALFKGNTEATKENFLEKNTLLKPWQNPWKILAAKFISNAFTGLKQEPLSTNSTVLYYKYTILSNNYTLKKFYWF